MLIFGHLDDGAAGSRQLALERPQQRAPDRSADSLFVDECGKQANDDEADPAPPTDLGCNHPYEFTARDGDSSEDVRLTVLHLGRILAESSRQAVRDNPHVQRVYLGERAASEEEATR